MQVLQPVREENSENLPAGCRGEILKGFLFRKVSFCNFIQFLINKNKLNFFSGLTKKSTKFKILLKKFLTFLKEFLWSSNEDANMAQC
jgi:hypothetical protein